MPRRNRRNEPRWFTERPPIHKDPSLEDLARDLVDRGLCSPLILHRPYRKATDDAA